jgi:ABC-type lipoprotein export system ATPase subunit
MKTSVQVSSSVERTARVLQVEGIFDIPPSKRSEQQWNVDLPIELKPWNVGLIVGPSGCGKSTVARELFPESMKATYEWSGSQSILDGFPASMGVKEIVDLMSSVGFSSPPSWLRPFHTLSNGEQFRVTMARTLAESKDLAVVDEFTSVVDRTVARIGSCAMAKTVRRREQKFIAVTCHEDVEEWLQPDWVYRPAEQTFAWRLLRRRPPIELEIRRVNHSMWKIFKRHHYLSQDINPACYAFCAFLNGQPIAFDAWLPFVGKLKDSRKARRGHRTVCLPDYQGVGIGGALFGHIASAWAALGLRAFSNTAHPAEIRNRARSPNWKMIRPPSRTARDNNARLNATRASGRLSASFEYVGAKMPIEQAHALMMRT